ncbi:hypothetical protein JXK06_02075 [Patescibacteria group bacterium]|nr:hypothetical protein [Patescibacteria group bacterium]
MKIKHHLQAFLGITVITAFLVLPFLVFAQSASPSDPSFENQTENNRMLNKLESVGSGGGYFQDVSLASAAGLVVRAALSLLGVIFIILLIVGGYKWMTAGGNEENVKTATNYIKRSIIGLIIILASWAIWLFISLRLT